MNNIFQINKANTKFKILLFFIVIVFTLSFSDLVYAANHRPTLTSVIASPSPIQTGKQVTITPTGQGDADANNLKFYCSASTSPTSGNTLCSQGNQAYTSAQYSSMTCTFNSPATALDVYCRVYDGILYSSPAVQTGFIVDNTAPTNQNYIFPTSETTLLSIDGSAFPSVTITPNAYFNYDNYWFAPFGTTTFINDGITMSKNLEPNEYIFPPTRPGDYRLFVVDEAGNVSEPSTAILTVVLPDILRIQSVIGSNVLNRATLTGSWPAPTTAGNLLVAIVSCRGCGVTPPSGKGWESAGGQVEVAGISIDIDYIENANSQSGISEWKLSNTSSTATIALVEYSGVTKSLAFDQTGFGYGPGNPVSSGQTSEQRTQEREVSIAGISVANKWVTFPFGSNTNYRRVGVAQTGGTSETAFATVFEDMYDVAKYYSQTNFTMSGGGFYVGKIATFKAAMPDETAPTGGSITYSYTSPTITINFSKGTDTESGIDNNSGIIYRHVAPLTGETCGTYANTQITSMGAGDTSYEDKTVTTNNCYMYDYSISDNKANVKVYMNPIIIKTVPATAPAKPVLTFPLISTSEIDLAWTGSDGNSPTSYEIKRSLDGIKWKTLFTNTGNPSPTTYQDKSFIPLPLGTTAGATTTWFCNGTGGNATCTATRIAGGPTVSGLNRRIDNCEADSSKPGAGTSNVYFWWTYDGAVAQKSSELRIYDSANNYLFSRTVDGTGSAVAINVLTSQSTEEKKLGFNLTYNWKVIVTDNNNAASIAVAGASFTTPVKAYPHAVITSNVEFPVVKQSVCLSGDSSRCYLANGSSSICQPVGSVTPYTWVLDSTFSLTTDLKAAILPCHSWTIVNAYTEKLTVCDNSTSPSQCCSTSKIINVKNTANVPEWKEISPF